MPRPVPEWADPQIPSESLDPQGMSRRRLLSRAGLLGAAIDAHGPTRHDPGNGDPWLDTWCYTNPIFVDVVR
jgi:hypothetical protein